MNTSRKPFCADARLHARIPVGSDHAEFAMQKPILRLAAVALSLASVASSAACARSDGGAAEVNPGPPVSSTVTPTATPTPTLAVPSGSPSPERFSRDGSPIYGNGH
jgi:hypothetical protein